MQREDPAPVPLVTGDPAPMPLASGYLALMLLASGIPASMSVVSGDPAPMPLASGDPESVPKASEEPAPMLLASGDPGLMPLASRDSASMPLSPGDLASMPLARSPCTHAQGILRAGRKGIFLAETSSRVENSPLGLKPQLLALQTGGQRPRFLQRTEMLTCEWPGSKLTPAAVGSEGNEDSHATLVGT